jgi:hypothetical protein
MCMLSAPKIDHTVFQLHFQMIKNLVVQSLDAKEGKQSFFTRDQDEEMSDEAPETVFD